MFFYLISKKIQSYTQHLINGHFDPENYSKNSFNQIIYKQKWKMFPQTRQIEGDQFLISTFNYNLRVIGLYRCLHFGGISFPLHSVWNRTGLCIFFVCVPFVLFCWYLILLCSAILYFV